MANANADKKSEIAAVLDMCVAELISPISPDERKENLAFNLMNVLRTTPDVAIMLGQDRLDQLLTFLTNPDIHDVLRLLLAHAIYSVMAYRIKEECERGCVGLKSLTKCWNKNMHTQYRSIIRIISAITMAAFLAGQAAPGYAQTSQASHIRQEHDVNSATLASALGGQGPLFSREPFGNPEANKGEISHAFAGGDFFKAGNLSSVHAYRDEFLSRPGKLYFYWLQFIKKIRNTVGIPKFTFRFQGLKFWYVRLHGLLPPFIKPAFCFRHSSGSDDSNPLLSKIFKNDGEVSTVSCLSKGNVSNVSRFQDVWLCLKANFFHLAGFNPMPTDMQDIVFVPSDAIYLHLSTPMVSITRNTKDVKENDDSSCIRAQAAGEAKGVGDKIAEELGGQARRDEAGAAAAAGKASVAAEAGGASANAAVDKSAILEYMQLYLDAVRSGELFKKPDETFSIKGRAIIDTCDSEPINVDSSDIFCTTGCSSCAPVMSHTSGPETGFNHLLHFVLEMADRLPARINVKNINGVFDYIGNYESLFIIFLTSLTNIYMWNFHGTS